MTAPANALPATATLAGRQVLVTGGSSGIGRACAERYRAEGATVHVADLHPSSSDEIHLDVAEPAAWASVVAALPPLDVVHLNAGIATPGRHLLRLDAPPLLDVSDEAYRSLLGVNVDGVVFGVRAVVEGMVTRGEGQILVTASMAGLVGMPTDVTYAATKHAVVGLVRSLGPALEPHGVCVSALCPGFVDTPLVPDDARELIAAAGMPVIAPARVAEAAVRALEARVAGSQWMIWGDEIRMAPVPELGLW